MKIGIAADHAGQRLKAAIVEHLKAGGHTVVVFGPETTPDDDYPLIVRPLADAIPTHTFPKPTPQDIDPRWAPDAPARREAGQPAQPRDSRPLGTTPGL